MRVIYTAFITFIAICTAVGAKEISFNEGTNFGVSISPDGLSLTTGLQGVLWIVPTAGGTAKALTAGQKPEAREPNYSPDGSKIAFHGFHKGYFHIWTINADGSNLKQITSGKYDDREPTWDPEGEEILFTSDRDGNYDIWQINLETGREIKLTDHPDDEGYPIKNADGSKLLYTREIKGTYSQVRMIDLEDDEKTDIAIIKSTTAKFYHPAWARDGVGFSYLKHVGNDVNLYYVTDVYSLEAQKDAYLIDDGDVFPFKSSWSEDGIYYTADGQIKFRSVKQQKRRNSISVSLGDIEPVLFNATITANPPVYADKHRDFDSTAGNIVRGIGSMDVSYSDDRLLFTALGDMWVQDGNDLPQNLDDGPGQINDPTWSRDGEHIAFVAERDGQMDIWLRDMESNEETRLTNDKNREYRISWSRDGRYIAYLSTRGVSNTWGRANLNVIDAKYGNVHVIDEDIHTPGRPVWAMDGDHVILAVADPASSRFREGTHVIRRYNVETKIFNNQEMPGGLGLSTRDGSGPVITDDGGKLAYISEGEVRVAYVNSAGEITGTVENRCTDTAHMPRWARNDETIYYMSGQNLKSCNYLSGETQRHNINLTWARARADDKTIHVEKLFDGVSDSYHENVDVFISNGRITKVVPHGQDRVIGEFVDYSRDTMLPGLMAGHTHQTELYGEKLGRNWLAYGITSVRDPGTNPYKSLMRKETWESGKAKGPRMFYAGWLTGGARVYYGQSYNAVNMKALRHELFRAKDLDYDMIKSYVRLPDEFQQILIEEAHKMGIPLSSHEIAPAVQNGMDSVEHIGATSRRGYSPKLSYAGKSYGDVINIISGSGLFITPTATLDTAYHSYIQELPEYVSNIKYRTFLDEYQRDGLRRTISRPYAILEMQKTAAVNETIKKLHDAGANVAAGTDSPFLPYGIAQHFEIFQFVDAGLTPADALRAATIKVAQNIGVENDLGSIEVGKLADMVIVDGDPLNDIRDILNVEATIKGGHLYTIKELTTNIGDR